MSNSRPQKRTHEEMLIDVIDESSRNITDAVNNIASAVTPIGALPYHDEDGGHITSLTEAAIGIGNGLNNIAVSIHELAEAISKSQEK